MILCQFLLQYPTIFFYILDLTEDITRPKVENLHYDNQEAGLYPPTISGDINIKCITEMIIINQREARLESKCPGVLPSRTHVAGLMDFGREYVYGKE